LDAWKYNRTLLRTGYLCSRKRILRGVLRIGRVVGMMVGCMYLMK